MSQTLLRQCNHPDREYAAQFEKEPLSFCCKLCFEDGDVDDAEKIINMKTKEEVSI